MKKAVAAFLEPTKKAANSNEIGIGGGGGVRAFVGGGVRALDGGGVRAVLPAFVAAFVAALGGVQPGKLASASSPFDFAVMLRLLL
jgi:hypothetical protein